MESKGNKYTQISKLFHMNIGQSHDQLQHSIHDKTTARHLFIYLLFVYSAWHTVFDANMQTLTEQFASINNNVHLLY